MLFPENPDDRPEFWVCLKEQLLTSSICLVICDGIGCPDAVPRKMDEDQASKLLSRMRSVSIRRISVNRGKAIGPHFAARLVDDTAMVTELMIASDRDRLMGELRRNLETVVVNLLYGEAPVLAVKVPLQLEPWEMKDIKVHSVVDGLVFRDSKTA